MPKLRFDIAMFLATPFLWIAILILKAFKMTFNIYIGTCSREQLEKESEYDQRN